MPNLYCNRCGRSFDISEAVGNCPCGGVLELPQEPFPWIDSFQKGDLSIWRYRDALPVEDYSNIVSLGEGLTPILKDVLLDQSVYLKLEFLQPTGSFKDRGASVLVSRMKEMGVKEIVGECPGNAGDSICAYCAAAGIKARIYVPRTVSRTRIAQMEVYGAQVIEVKATREELTRIAIDESDMMGRYFASPLVNPFFLEGIKTFAFEVWEQIPEAEMQEMNIVLPVGSGTLLLGTHMGFKGLYLAGLIDQMPRIFGVQPERCAPLYFAFQSESHEIPRLAVVESLAEGAILPNPPRAGQILDAVSETGGSFVTVSEDRIRTTVLELGKKGLFVEPTAALGPAGVSRLLEVGMIRRGDPILVPLTGSGLKAIDALEAILRS